jgi:hypothetical protein
MDVLLNEDSSKNNLSVMSMEDRAIIVPLECVGVA